MVIAIDGPSGSGKTSTSRYLAEKMNFYYCDSGSLYRAITYHLINIKADLDDEESLRKILSTLAVDYNVENNIISLNEENVTNYLRSDIVTKHVSKISSVKIVRDFLITSQRELAKYNDIIVDGRDIGTTVFPDADYKFYIDADIKIRARRRFDELSKKGGEHSYNQVLEMIEKRDSYDLSREHSPLKKAADAVYIDTTKLTLEQQVDKIIDSIKNN